MAPRNRLSTTRVETMHGQHKLADLAGAAGDVVSRIEGDDGTVVDGLTFDSRSVGPGDLFFCVRGFLSDGHDFAPAAVDSGAIALCVERDLGLGVPEVVVSDARVAMARISAAFFENPADRMTMLGVTGTNGKTTTVFLLESILAAAGRSPGLIGTIQTRVGDHVSPGVRTTPESLDLQKLLAEMQAQGADSIAMEVTSHALAMDRVEGIRFTAAAFTNLSQDHLDFHQDMEDYFEAKARLFTPDHLIAGATNLDDPYGRRLLEASEVPCIGFGLALDARVRAENVTLGQRGSEFIIVIEDVSGITEKIPVSTGLVGSFNVSNCLAAAATALLAGIEPDAIRRGLQSPTAIPGRFESIDMGQPFGVVVDYADTPDSLDNVLRAARGLVRDGGRVIVAFGCGGDRDRTKRPLMGIAAARLADYVVVTSDNPRSEDPGAIVEEILEGVKAERAGGADAALVDRREAIVHVLGEAKDGDVVVIAGKGHETGQQFADVTIPFDDREVAREVLVELGRGTGA